MNAQPESDLTKPRLEYWKAAPEVMKAMLALETATRGLGIEQSMQELIKLRVSQINGCAFCADMHSRDAKKHGETDQRLHVLAYWRETHVFTPKERAVLHWVEALTKLPGNHVTDEDFQQISAHFTEEEITKITLAIVTINGWNRFGVGFRMPLGYVG